MIVAGVDLGFQKGVLTETFIWQQLAAYGARSIWEARRHAPTGKFCKFGLLRLNLVVIFTENDITLFLW